MDDKNCKDSIISFATFYGGRLIRMISLHYHKLVGKIEKCEANKYYS